MVYASGGEGGGKDGHALAVTTPFVVSGETHSPLTSFSSRSFMAAGLVVARMPFVAMGVVFWRR